MTENLNPAALTALAKGDIDNFIVASSPGGIEAQEKAGQEKMVNSNFLPKQMDTVVKEKLEELGVKFLDDYDDIFVNVLLPNGWKKISSDHDMWSYLVNEKDERIANIFYKAAFYDTRAHLTLS